MRLDPAAIRFGSFTAITFFNKLVKQWHQHPFLVLHNEQFGEVKNVLFYQISANFSNQSSLNDALHKECINYDYYPFGMGMPGRKYQVGSSSYRYGFNGKELDKEAAGSSGYNFDARLYDGRIGRWYSTDPKDKAFISPYSFVQNNPVNRIDPDGKDDIHFYFVTSATTKTYGIGVSQRTVTYIHTSAFVYVEKNNSPDRFYHHRITGSREKTTEFYPFQLESRSGLTQTSMPFSFGLINRNDRDVHTLSKFYDASPEFKSYLDQRRSKPGFEYSENGRNYSNIFDPNRKNFNFWGKVSKYSEITADGLMLARGGLALAEKNSVSIFRNFGADEMASLAKNNMKFSLQEGGSIGKDFWLTKGGLKAWKSSGWGGAFSAEVKVSSSYFKSLPKDAFFTDNLAGGAFDAANIKNMDALNKAIKSIKINLAH